MAISACFMFLLNHTFYNQNKVPNYFTSSKLKCSFQSLSCLPTLHKLAHKILELKLLEEKIIKISSALSSFKPVRVRFCSRAVNTPYAFSENWFL